MHEICTFYLQLLTYIHYALTSDSNAMFEAAHNFVYIFQLTQLHRGVATGHIDFLVAHVTSGDLDLAGHSRIFLQ